MKTKLYKVLDISDYENCDDFEKTQIMAEKDIRKEFLWAYNNGNIPHELIDDYKSDPDYSKENWKDIGNLRIGTMIDMLNDIPSYVCGEGYYILETVIEL